MRPEAPPRKLLKLVPLREPVVVDLSLRLEVAEQGVDFGFEAILRCLLSEVLDRIETYVPGGVSRAYLRIRWFETDEFNIHYSEQYRTETTWECRWDRHPNEHNTREHFHPPPDAPTPGTDEAYPTEWREVLKLVLGRFDDRIEAFWSE